MCLVNGRGLGGFHRLSVGDCADLLAPSYSRFEIDVEGWSKTTARDETPASRIPMSSLYVLIPYGDHISLRVGLLQSVEEGLV